jgi:16S rRNA (adenine1518-N6/adenine1519-N6)-dimethyltransferase
VHTNDADLSAATLTPLLDKPALLRRLRQLDLRPVKALGQNFLIEPNVLQTTIDAAELERSDRIIEVGPGPGVLTAALLAVAGHVTAVEVDRNMVDLLKPLKASCARLSVVQGNILTLDLALLTRGEPYKVVANLPYYITSLALRYFLESTHKPSMMVVMVQREVALRICARPNDMSILAVSVQAFAAPEIMAFVPPDAFFPAPKVASAVLRLRVLSNPRIPPERQRRFFRLVRAGFHDKRKQLHNAFARNLGTNQRTIEDVLSEARVAGDRRAETLSLDEWLALTESLERHEA